MSRPYEDGEALHQGSYDLGYDAGVESGYDKGEADAENRVRPLLGMVSDLLVALDRKSKFTAVHIGRVVNGLEKYKHSEPGQTWPEDRGCDD